MNNDFLGDSFKYDPDYHRVAEYIGLDHYTREEVEIARKVAYIYDWAKTRVGRDDLQTVFGEISRLQQKLGIHSIGEELLTNLYRAARLDSGKKVDRTRDMEIKERERQQVEERIKIEKEGENWRKNLNDENKIINRQNKEADKQLAKDIAEAKKVVPEKVERIKEVVTEYTSEKV